MLESGRQVDRFDVDVDDDWAETQRRTERTNDTYKYRKVSLRRGSAQAFSARRRRLRRAVEALAAADRGGDGPLQQGYSRILDDERLRRAVEALAAAGPGGVGPLQQG